MSTNDADSFYLFACMCVGEIGFGEQQRWGGKKWEGGIEK